MQKRILKKLPKSYMVNGKVVKVERVINPYGMDVIENLILYYHYKEMEKERNRRINANINT